LHYNNLKKISKFIIILNINLQKKSHTIKKIEIMDRKLLINFNDKKLIIIVIVMVIIITFS